MDRSTKRARLIVAGAAAAALAGGGTALAVSGGPAPATSPGSGATTITTPAAPTAPTTAAPNASPRTQAPDRPDAPGTEQADGNDAAQNAQIIRAAKVDIQQAATTARGRVPGVVLEAGLEMDNAKVVWNVKVADQNGGKTQDVVIDASGGQVIQVTADS